jgi:GT2 family glycosyltransferase
MEGLSIIIPVFNKMETTLRCIQSICEENASALYEIVIVDNGSTDGTQAFFSGEDNPPSPPFKKGGWPEASFKNMARQISPPLKKGDEGGFSDNARITYIRNPENLGVSRALNTGSARAQYDILCFMHNDVIVHKKNWISSIREFITSHPDAGVVGLYGAKTVREDGSFRGKSIVHAKKDGPSMKKPFETVAVVDGMLMAMKKPVFERVDGFSDDFIVHFYDKDISLKAITGNYVNYVLNIPFEHVCAATRSDISDDDRIRDEAKDKFLGMWADSLPVNVTTWREKIKNIGRRKRNC